MITAFVVISLLLHFAVPVSMWLHFSNRIDKQQRQIETLKDDVLFAELKAKPPISSKYSPRWRDYTAGHDRQPLSPQRKG